MNAKEVRPKKRGRPRAVESANTKENVLDAAQACFAENGMAATTNAIIARRAGVTASALYNHFASKSDLYVAVFERAEKAVLTSHQEAIANRDNSVDALIATLDASEKLFAQDPSLPSFISKVSVEIAHKPELALPLAEKMSGKVQKLLKKIIRQGQAKGEISKEVSAEVISQMITACTMGLAQSGARYGPRLYHTSMQAFKALLMGQLFFQKD